MIHSISSMTNKRGRIEDLIAAHDMKSAIPFVRECAGKWPSYLNGGGTVRAAQDV
jgi:hypothetical protein